VRVATEHKCVLASVADLEAEGFEPVVLPVGRDGLLDLEHLRAALKTPTLLVSVMAMNNEIGTIQDIQALASVARAAGALLHTEAAQAVGKIAVEADGWGVDLLSLNGHKLLRAKRRRRGVRSTPTAHAARTAVLRRRAGARPARRNFADADDCRAW